MARHGNIAAKDADGIVRAQCSGKHDPPARDQSKNDSGTGPIQALSKAMDWLMR